MTAEKGKRQHSLPDRRLALAFRFSANDLATNRNGYISRSQAWAIPLFLRGRFHQFGEWSGLENRSKSQRQALETSCGRAILTYEQQQIQSHFHSDFIEIHKLSINTLEFRLNPVQYQAIGEGLFYHLYYNPDTKQILSIERAINGC